MSAQQANAETIFVSRLRATETLAHGRIRQVFDVLNLPGMQVVYISADIGSGGLEPISQEYSLANGTTYDDIDSARLACDDIADEMRIIDAIGAALLRHSHGLIR